jgi:hypothetical protein
MRLLACFILPGVLVTSWAAEVPIQVDVCTVLEAPLRFNGVLIAARGIAHFTDGLTLQAETCLKRIVLDRVVFRNEIAIEKSTDQHASFTTDEASLGNLEVANAQFNPATQYVSATFVGIFETREPLGDLVAEHGQTNGYGYMGRAPGRLVLREVKDISVTTKPPSPQVLSVCELLATPLAFNGKLVSVKGAIRTFQGLWLYDDQCPSKITVQGRSFDSLIAITYPNSILRIHDVPFDTDDDSMALMSKAFGPSALRPRVFATFIGVFETRDDLKLVSRNGRSLGFGDQGEAPAQLLLKECREVNTIYVPLR